MTEETPTFDSEAEAAAHLAAKKISSFGGVDRAEADGTLVRIWINGQGANFLNVFGTFKIDLGEIGPIEAYNDNIYEKATEETVTYANMDVIGVREDEGTRFGYGSPTHAPGKASAKLRDPDDLDPDVRRAGKIAGILEDSGLLENENAE